MDAHWVAERVETSAARTAVHWVEQWAFEMVVHSVAAMADSMDACSVARWVDRSVEVMDVLLVAAKDALSAVYWAEQLVGEKDVTMVVE